MLTKEHKWAIHQWITQDCHLELANIQAMVKSTFGVEALISFYYHLVKGMRFSWKNIGVSPYNWNSPTNIETRKNYAEAYIALKNKGTVKFYYIDKSAFALLMHNEYGYVPKGSNDGVARRAAVRATAYSMVALLGPKGVELYQMILGLHNSRTFLSFLRLVQEHLRRTSLGFTNVIVLDNVGLHKVADILAEFPSINTSIAVGPQRLATANLRLLFLPVYLPFLNPIKEVFGWLKQVVKQGTPTGTEDLFDLLQAGIHTLPADTVAKFYVHADSFIPLCFAKQLIN